MPGQPFPIEKAKIIQITKVDPKKIKLDPLTLPNLENAQGTPGQGAPAMPLSPSKFMGSAVPFISIGNDILDVTAVREMTLSIGSNFLPSINFLFRDLDRKYKGSVTLGDGEAISLFLRGPGDDKFYKPIRMDFDISSFFEIGSDNTTYSVTGQLRIPNLFRDSCTSIKATSFNAILNLANQYGLGFASNLTETKDEMTWINPTDFPIDFIESIAKSAYFDEESFFTVFVDQFYNINFVELNRVFDHDGSVSVAKNYGAIDFSANPTGYAKADNGGVDFPQIYANHENFQGTGKYLRDFKPFNRMSEITKESGYRKFSQFYDVPQKKFISEYVEALSNTGNDQAVLLKGRYVPDDKNPQQFVREFKKGDAKTPIDQVLNYKIKYLGKLGENTHKNFVYSAVFNSQNLKEIEKFGLEIMLDQLDQTITMFDRIFVMVFNYGIDAQSATKNNEVLQKVMKPGLSGQLAKSSQLKQLVDSFQNDENTANAIVMSDTYSGVYVVTGIKYEYVPNFMSIKTRIIVSRRDYLPAP